MEISKLLSDAAILAELGERMAQYRIARQLTQAMLAEQAGVSKRTVERVEAGASAQMSSIVRIMRVLELLPNLDRTFPATGPSPMDLLKRRGRERQRVSKQRDVREPDEKWSWDEGA